MEPEFRNLKKKVVRYGEVLESTQKYRQIWLDELSQRIMNQLNYIISQVGLEATVEVRSELENLEAIDLSLGTVRSGLFQRVNGDVQRDLIKQNGALIYQQLFNGKVLVLIQYPMIEGYGEPRPPKTIAIYRPEELNDAFFLRHVEEFMQEVILWEDYDDDEPHQRIGFNLNYSEQAEK